MAKVEPTIAPGATRRKLVEVEGLTADEVDRRLDAARRTD
jgi:hypothetical protein